MDNKIGIGTAQFGNVYGAFNQHGKTPLKEVEKIINYCLEKKVYIIDTAPTYGESELVIGKCLPLYHPFKIITKTPHFKTDKITTVHTERLVKTFLLSLEKLKQPSLYGLLIHHVNDLFVDNGHLLYEVMQEFKRKKLVKKIGVSIYTGEQIDQLMCQYHFDLVQLPINIFDQRLIEGGQLKKLKEQGVEIHARSAFLQGLLVTPPDNLHSYFNNIKNRLIEYYKFIQAYSLSPTQAALGFLKQINEIDVIVLGVETKEQLKENIKDYSRVWPRCDLSQFAISDENIINPTCWKI
ncbi:aldo/keto reductase [Alkalihalobacterium alkalinitrilicum]|uniref:aldo/keto reductase n=1 Tax=Alkalihalobacterium alkalinitrilicum TaxID=427920 RepID=UPI001C5689B6|nr:aldo/keto reductase [Alkalihalobacterium alkalinitrilicum]